MQIIRWLLLSLFTVFLVIGGRSLPVQSQTPDPLPIVLQLQHQALEQQQEGEIFEAIATIQDSLTLLNPPTTTHQEQALANSLNILGDLYFTQSHFQAALEQWETAQPVYDQTLEWATYRHRNLIKQSQAQQHLGRLTQSCQLLLKSLNLSDPLICDAKGTIDDLKSLIKQFSHPTEQDTESLLELADLWRTVGNFDDANEVLELFSEKSDHPQVILTRANVARSRGDQERAQQEATQGIQFDIDFCPSTTSELYQQAIEAYQRLHNNSDARVQLRSHIYTLTTQLLQGNIADAITITNSQALQNPVKLVTPKSHPDDLMLLLQYAQSLNCIDVQSERHELQEFQTHQQKLSETQYTEIAIKLVQEIASTAHDQGNKQLESYALGYQGRFYEKSQQLDQAFNATEQALTLSGELPHLQYQWLWQKARILRQQNQPREKILPIYRLSYKILEGLRKNLVTFNQDVQYDFRDRVEPLYREYVDLLLRPTVIQSKIQQKDLQTARDIIEDLKLTELNNFFQENCAVFPREEIESLAQDTVILYPILLKDRVTILVKYPQEQDLREYHSSIAGKHIEQLIEQFRNNLARPGQFRAVQRQGAILYQNILQNVLQDIENNPELQINTLVFVLDTTLQQIPMAALFDGEHYLIERYAIAIAPGLQLIKPQTQRSNISQAFFAGVSKANKQRAPLPMVEYYQKLIQTVLPQTTVALNEKLDLETFAQAVREEPMQVFHVATHAVFSSNPEKTFIAVWDGEIKAQKLKRLFLQREARRSPPIDLLVLAACETATNDKRATLGLAGLATQSGARSTVAALWLIEANAIPGEFARSLYEYIQDPQLTKAQAFQKAQVELLHRTPNKTKQWAPYVLVGNWS
jgi:CHAT domain-containing protein